MKLAPIVAMACSAFVCVTFCSPMYALAGGPQTNLAVAVQAPDNPIIAGAPAQYSVTATNQGPAQAVSVVTTLALPAGMSFVSVIPSTNCEYASGVVACTRATLDVSESTTFTVNTVVTPNARGTLLVSGATRSSITDPDQNNNIRVVSTVVQPEIDLQLGLDGMEPAVAIAGMPLTYQFQINNNGRSTATNTVMQLNLPANTIEQVVSSSAGTQCAMASTTISCALGTIAPAGIVDANWITSGTVITVAVKLKASLLPNSALLAGVSVDGEELEAKTANNFIYHVNEVARLTDLGLQVNDIATQVTSGGEIVYTFVARNHGPSNHDDVVFSSVFPQVFAVKEVMGANCTLTTGTVSCALGTLVPNQEATIVVRGRPLSVMPAVLQLVAEVRGKDAEPQAGSANSITQTVQIIPNVVFAPIASR